MGTEVSTVKFFPSLSAFEISQKILGAKGMKSTYYFVKLDIKPIT